MKRFAIAASCVLAWGCQSSEPALDVGDDMPALAWEGYVNDGAVGLASEQPFVSYSTSALRDSGKRYALVHLSEEY